MTNETLQPLVRCSECGESVPVAELPGACPSTPLSEHLLVACRVCGEWWAILPWSKRTDIGPPPYADYYASDYADDFWIAFEMNWLEPQQLRDWRCCDPASCGTRFLAQLRTRYISGGRDGVLAVWNAAAADRYEELPPSHPDLSESAGRSERGSGVPCPVCAETVFPPEAYLTKSVPAVFCSRCGAALFFCARCGKPQIDRLMTSVSVYGHSRYCLDSAECGPQTVEARAVFEKAAGEKNTETIIFAACFALVVIGLFAVRASLDLRVMAFWVLALLLAVGTLSLGWQEKHLHGNRVDSDAPVHVKAMYPILMALGWVLLLVFFALQIVGDPDRVLRGGP